jgi:glycosyltransferase involved in cell wall biosynthesis
MIDISIVIPTYNRRHTLLRCLECLFHQDYPEDRYEIIVVDDGSTDGTKEEIETLNPTCGFRYLYQANMGPHIARNLGLKEARGDVILFIDSDILAPPPLLKEHMRLHRREERVVVSGPLTETRRVDDGFKGIKVRRLLALFDLSGPSLITSNLSIERRYLLEIGGFDEEFEGYGWHDWELGERLKKIGLKVIRSPSALAYHLREWDTSTFEELLRKRYERGRNAILYLRKHPGIKTLLSIHPHFLLYDRFISLWGKERDIPLRWLLIHKYAQGLREGLKREEMRTILRWM